MYVYCTSKMFFFDLLISLAVCYVQVVSNPTCIIRYAPVLRARIWSNFTPVVCHVHLIRSSSAEKLMKLVMDNTPDGLMSREARLSSFSTEIIIKKKFEKRSSRRCMCDHCIKWRFPKKRFIYFYCETRDRFRTSVHYLMKIRLHLILL